MRQVARAFAVFDKIPASFSLTDEQVGKRVSAGRELLCDKRFFSDSWRVWKAEGRCIGSGVPAAPGADPKRVELRAWTTATMPVMTGTGSGDGKGMAVPIPAALQ
jgi:hypothetical protein